jgi:biopolymer transport protein ExbD
VDKSGFQIDLPRAAQAGRLASMGEQLIVSLLEDGRIVVRGEALGEVELEQRFKQVHAANALTQVVVQAERLVPHWRLVRVMDLALESGLSRLAIATEQAGSE